MAVEAIVAGLVVGAMDGFCAWVLNVGTLLCFTASAFGRCNRKNSLPHAFPVCFVYRLLKEAEK